jgi:GT2 family glycosyltransferase
MQSKNPLKIGVRKGLNVSFTQGKKLLNKSPRTKFFLRNIILDYVHTEAAAITNNKYQQWVLQNYPDAVELMHERRQIDRYKYKPLISILVPTYNTDLGFLKDCVESVQAQSYDNWELILVDDASPNQEVRDAIKGFADTDERIRYEFCKKNGHISAATNVALALAKGEFVALLDHDDVLWPNALFENIKALNDDPKIDFLYSDEDKITANKWEHKDLFLKPDWNPEFLESVNYITHFSVLRTSVVKKVGGWRGKYDGAQDWDLFLRVSDATKRIHHIPKVLYSWRISATSAASGIEAKPYARDAQRLAIVDSLSAKGYKNAKVITGLSPDYWTVKHPIKGSPKVSIVIPTKDQFKIVRRCVNSIFKKTTYKNFEVVLVDTGSADKRIIEWYKKLTARHKNVKVVDWPEQPFSYSRACNFGVKNADGEYILLLNNDVEVITSDWIETLLSDAQREGIGGVGCKLYYPEGKRIQHAGIGIGLNNTAANLLSEMHNNNKTLIQHLYADTRHELSAVTAACMMVKKDRFDEVGGFDEEFRITYNDVDLCLKLKKAGYRNIYNPHAELIHHESVSIGLPTELAKARGIKEADRQKYQRDADELEKTTKLLQSKWKKYIEHDPHINDNIDKRDAFLEPFVEEPDSAAQP